MTTPFLYSAGYTEDIRRVVAHLRAAHPAAKLFAVGFSLGSNKLAKFVGEEAQSGALDGAVCLAAPLDCLSMSNALSSRLVGRLMDPLLVRLVQDVKESHRSVLAMHPGVHLPTVDAARTMAEFDGAAIAPMMGEPSASQYYRSASAGRLLHRIATPTLIIHATNDPIVSAQSSLYELARVP
jgi:predicted alpha/beta-fold hydrolase